MRHKHLASHNADSAHSIERGEGWERKRERENAHRREDGQAANEWGNNCECADTLTMDREIDGMVAACVCAMERVSHNSNGVPVVCTDQSVIEAESIDRPIIDRIRYERENAKTQQVVPYTQPCRHSTLTRSWSTTSAAPVIRYRMQLFMNMIFPM